MAESDIVQTKMVLGCLVPDGAIRIKVIDGTGKRYWRKLEEVKNGTDKPELDSDGRPMYMFKPFHKNEQLESLLPPPASPVVGDLIKVKASQIRTDQIVQIIDTNPESPEVLNMALQGLAEEAASLRFERMTAERKGEDSSQLSMRRTQVLKAIGDTWIKRREQMNNRVIDIDSPAFASLFRYISETIARAMEAANVHQDQIDTVFSKLANMLDDGWKQEARNRMKE